MATFEAMNGPSLHRRAFSVAVVWTLGLLFLGSVVHATESSLACPDWPTCYGSFFPEMTGGVFWEHLHRMVAGGLVLLWGLATWLVWNPGRERRWMRTAAVGGLLVLVVQSVLGGITVILELPDAVSTAHLALAFAFLALAVVLATASAPDWGRPDAGDTGSLRALRPWTVGVAGLVFVQSALGAWVRHRGAGLACPDVPLCLGSWVPPLEQELVALHFAHRVLGVALAVAVPALASTVVRNVRTAQMRWLAGSAVALVLLQVALGFLSVSSFLAVLPVSAHTLVAAALLAVLTSLAARTWEPATAPDGRGAAPAPAPAGEG